MFVGGEAGISIPETVCTARSIGISVDVNTYEPHLLAGTMAHMIGHNIGMDHDDNRDECYCRDWHGCIMSQSIIGQENVQPYKFSECSKTDYTDALRIGHGLCLLNKPNEVSHSLSLSFCSKSKSNVVYICIFFFLLISICQSSWKSLVEKIVGTEL
jgi:hypothetical protein